MSFVAIPGLVTAEPTDVSAEAAEVQVPSAEVPEGATVHDVVIVGSGPAGYTAVRAWPPSSWPASSPRAARS